MADERILFDFLFPGALQGDAFHTPTVDFSLGSPAFNQVLAELVTRFADFRTQQFFDTANLQVNPFDPPNQIPAEIITSGLTGAGFSVLAMSRLVFDMPAQGIRSGEYDLVVSSESKPGSPATYPFDIDMM